MSFCLCLDGEEGGGAPDVAQEVGAVLVNVVLVLIGCGGGSLLFCWQLDVWDVRLLPGAFWRLVGEV